MSFSTRTTVAAGLVAMGLALAAAARASYSVAVKKRTLVVSGSNTVIQG